MKGEPPVQEALQAGIGSEEIGRSRQDEGIRLQNRLQDPGEIIILRAGALIEEAGVAGATGLDIHIGQTNHLKPVWLEMLRLISLAMSSLFPSLRGEPTRARIRFMKGTSLFVTSPRIP